MNMFLKNVHSDIFHFDMTPVNFFTELTKLINSKVKSFDVVSSIWRLGDSR